MASDNRTIRLDSPEGREISALYELARQIRAPFLEQAISIERLIDDIIAWHFCATEELRAQFFSTVLGGADLSFSAKINILETTLRLAYYEVYQKHKTLREELDKIRSFRNRLVHSMLDTSDEFMGKSQRDRIQLVFYEDGRKKQHIITVADIDKRLRSCTAALRALIEVQKVVSKGAA